MKWGFSSTEYSPAKKIKDTKKRLLPTSYWRKRKVWQLELPFGYFKALRQGKKEGCSCVRNSREKLKQTEEEEK